MRIVDLRPGQVRFMSSLWSRGKPVRGPLDEDPGPGHPGVRMAAWIADGIMSRLVTARRSPGDGPFILSVGNLALGGTGKTPVVVALAGALAATGRRGAILTRGFGSPLAGPLTVSADNALAGDEARLMASTLDPGQWPVIQSRRRERGLDFLVENHPGTEIVIVEDGHQTARLGRHLDLVILDGWTVAAKGGRDRVRPVTGPVFPFGPWRESASGADRAGILLLETGEAVPAEGWGGQAVATFQRRLTLRRPEDGAAVKSPVGRAVVLSGIARPQAFEDSLVRVLGEAPVLAVRCGDHARYAPRLVGEITTHVRDAGADFLVTTAKDWVKLEPFRPRGLDVLVADLEIVWGHGQALPALVGQRLWDFGEARHK